MTPKTSQDNLAVDCELVACTSQLLPGGPDQERTPRLGRPEPGNRVAEKPDVVLVEFVSLAGPISEEMLQRPRNGRPSHTASENGAGPMPC